MSAARVYCLRANEWPGYTVLKRNSYQTPVSLYKLGEICFYVFLNISIRDIPHFLRVKFFLSLTLIAYGLVCTPGHFLTRFPLFNSTFIV